MQMIYARNANLALFFDLGLNIGAIILTSGLKRRYKIVLTSVFNGIKNKWSDQKRNNQLINVNQ